MKTIQDRKYLSGDKKGNEVDEEHIRSLLKIDNTLFLK